MQGWEGFTWHQEPTSWRVADGGLVLRTEPSTDFWQGTHYGFRNDNGHFFHTTRTGDFTLTCQVASRPTDQYDQAGLMVRIAPDCWLKTSVEYEPQGPSRLGAVVTNHGWSDWSTQDIAFPAAPIALRITRTGADYVVAANLSGGPLWTQLRIARLHADQPGAPVHCGPYACSPKGPGHDATFTDLSFS